MNMRFFLFLIYGHFLLAAPHFCVIIPTYKNAAYCLQNIEALVNQTYQDWHALVIVDGTREEDDGTAALLEQFILTHNLTDKITLQRPGERRKALHNIYTAVLSIDDPETVVVLYDGDDYFCTPQALERIAREYQDPTTWLTYGQYINVPQGTKGHCKPFPRDVLQKNSFRSYPWIASHPRTFKTWLFKCIHLEDLLHNSTFYPMAWDVAFMPLLEMAGKEHIRFIPDELYAYRHHGNNDYAINYQLLKRLEAHIRAKRSYKPLKHSRAQHYKNLQHAQCDLVIFSKDRPLQLYALLESLQKHAQGIATKTVIYHVSDNNFAQAYAQLKQEFTDVQFIEQSHSNPRADFKALTMQAIRQGPSQYILFAVDDIIIKDTIDCTQAIKTLEETHTYAVFLRVGKNTHYCYSCNFEQSVPPMIAVAPELYAWRFEGCRGDWGYPNNVDMTLYRKRDVVSFFEKYGFHNPNSLEGAWASQAQSALKKLGLCYYLSKIVNIPANIVQNEYNNRHMTEYSPAYLLELFRQGYKIDIQKYWQIHNNAAHTPLPLHLIRR